MKDPSTIIWIFIIIIFVAGPMIKKIMAGLSGTGPAQRSRQSVKEYLEKMRQEGRYKTHPKYQKKQQQHQPIQYRAPATRATSVPQKAKQAPKKFNRIERKVREDIEQHVQQDITDQVATYLDSAVTKHVAEQMSFPKAEGATKASELATAQVLQERILSKPSYTELQKAIILVEVFGKPIALKKG